MYAIYGNMDPINIPQMLAYIPYMDPRGKIEFQTKSAWNRDIWWSKARSLQFTLYVLYFRLLDVEMVRGTPALTLEGCTKMYQTCWANGMPSSEVMKAPL